MTVEHAVLLGRVDYAVLRQDIARVAGDQPSIGGVMDTVCARLATAFNARRVWWAEDRSRAGSGDARAARARRLPDRAAAT